MSDVRKDIEDAELDIWEKYFAPAGVGGAVAVGGGLLGRRLGRAGAKRAVAKDATERAARGGDKFRFGPNDPGPITKKEAQEFIREAGRVQGAMGATFGIPAGYAAYGAMKESKKRKGRK